MSDQYNPPIIEFWVEDPPLSISQRGSEHVQSVGKLFVTVFDNLNNDIISWGHSNLEDAANDTNLRGLDPEIIAFIFSDELIEGDEDNIRIENALRELIGEKLL